MYQTEVQWMYVFWHGCLRYIIGAWWAFIIQYAHIDNVNNIFFKLMVSDCWDLSLVWFTSNEIWSQNNCRCFWNRLCTYKQLSSPSKGILCLGLIILKTMVLKHFFMDSFFLQLTIILWGILLLGVNTVIPVPLPFQE